MRFAILTIYFILFVGVSAVFGANEKVTLQLQWLHQFQFAGYYIARDKGFYAEENLDVTFLEHRPNISVVEEVIRQKATYGTGKSSLLLHKSEGKPIVLLGAIFQQSPSALISTHPKIQSINDLENKKIMISKDEINSAAIIGMLKSRGLGAKNFTLQNHSYNLDDLLDGKTDAMASYISNEPAILEEKKQKYVVFKPQEYGFDFYGDLLFTSEDEIKNHPERAQKFFKASIKGWEYAFQNIEESAKLIFEKYNTQNKSLANLIYEGKVLKELAYANINKLGTIDTNKVKSIAKMYAVSGLMQNLIDFDAFVDPLHFSRQHIKIGILANRGATLVYDDYEQLAQILNQKLSEFRFSIVPIVFDEVAKAIADKKIDFIVTNPSFYVELENNFKISRIATLKNKSNSSYSLPHFGSVIFTRHDNDTIQTPHDIKYATVSAVNPNSFGGFSCARYELKKFFNIDILKNTTFSGTHDGSVFDVLHKKADVGIARTDILEKMVAEKKIVLSDLKIINEQHYKDFPFVISTQLYPEWALAKLDGTDEYISKKLLTSLMELTPAQSALTWTIPLDYSIIHQVHMFLKLPPYDQPITFEEIFHEYGYYILGSLCVFLLILFLLLKIYRFNQTLSLVVQAKTKELALSNEQLQELLNTDTLTKIASRRYFLEQAERYFYIARRNHTPLCILALDIDHFKNVNDTYGHDMGDAILRFYCDTLSDQLRKSDVFGRIGGEEFCVCIQNTNIGGALVLAEKLRLSIANKLYEHNGLSIKITTSIGIATLSERDDSINSVMKKADNALYESKNNGRNQVNVFREAEDQE